MSCIYRRKNGWLTHQVRIDGKYIRTSLHTKLMSEAKLKAAELDVKYNVTNSVTKDVTIEQALARYIQEKKFTRASQTNDDSKRKINAFFKAKDIRNFSDITCDKMNDFLNEIRASGRSEWSVSNYLEYNRIFLKWCVDKGYIQSNPIKSIPKCKPVSKKERFLTSNEVKRVLKEAKKEVLYPAVALACYAGMRKAEIFNLRKEDIDLKQGIIHVKNHDGFTTKSKKDRAIGISKPLASILRHYINKDDWMDFHNHRRVLKRIMRKSGVSWAGWHTLRHSFASNLVQNGVDILSVSKILGHHSVSITEQTYLHGTPEHQRQAVNSISY